LNPRPLSPEKRRDGHVSNLVDMKDRGFIPSLSYGYTAGAKSRKFYFHELEAYTDT
jgi:hypothetical protein